MKFPRHIILLTVAFFATLLPAPMQAQAQRVEPSDQFLQAYMAARDAEELEKQGKLEAALAKFRAAGETLDALKRANPDWQPMVVEFRAKRIRDNIVRLQDRLGLEDVVENTTPEFVAPVTEDISGPLPDNSAPDIRTTPAYPPSSYGNDPFEEIRNRMQRMERDLAEAQARERQRHAESLHEKRQREALEKELQEKNRELDKMRLAAAEERAKHTDLENQLKASAEATEKAIILEEQARRLEAELLRARAEREAADEESEAITTRLAEAQEQIVTLSTARTTAEKQRDEALGELTQARESQKELERLIAENETLAKKLSEAEENIRILSERPTLEDVAVIREQIQQIQTELAATQEENESFQNTIVGLRSQLAEANSALENAKLGTDTQQDPQLVEENRLLREILTRELDEQVRRDQAKKLVLEELAKLEGDTSTMLENLHFLSQPVYKLSEKELALLRPTDPTISAAEGSPNVSLSIAVPKEEETSGEPVLPEAGKSESDSPLVELDNTPPVPTELEPLARQAREYFNRKEYRDAEKVYEQILAQSPDNLYALSNLGVTRFRAGKLKAAELTFEKAIALNPEDSFNHGTLGIVYYRQARYDDAINVLTKAITLDPKNAIAHNYLGITASQKGWQEAAEKELQAAIALNPNYADAHFNIAVIYATSEPPSRELARKHYERAIQLGSEKDAAMEELLR